MKDMINNIPTELQEYLGEFCVCSIDSNCGEPTRWGFPIIKQCNSEIWQELGNYGELFCSRNEGLWFLVRAKLTREAAIEQYGYVTNDEFGPRGGWRSTTFGTTKFISKTVKP